MNAERRDAPRHPADRRVVACAVGLSLLLNGLVLSLLFLGMSQASAHRFDLNERDMPFSFIPAELIIDDPGLNPALAPDIGPEPISEEPEPRPEPEPSNTPKPRTPDVVQPMPPPEPAKTPRKVNTPQPDPARQAIDRVRERQQQRGQEGQVRGSISLRGAGGSGVGNRIVSIYLNSVYSKIMANWSSPPGLSAGEEVSVVIHIKIDDAGHVIYRQVIQSSGIPAVDQQALRAVEKSDPLAPPPELIRNVVAEDGLNLRFFPTGR